MGWEITLKQSRPPKMRITGSIGAGVYFCAEAKLSTRECRHPSVVGKPAVAAESIRPDRF
jgi:hypothetical protein